MAFEYESTNVDLMGLKFTMDGGADGHDLESAIDEIIHNFIDFDTDNIEISYEPEKYWAFRFNIQKEIDSPDDKINHGVTLYQTKGHVRQNDVGKYGKGIKCAAHCISPNGKMILGLVVNEKLYMGVYNQGSMMMIKCGTEQSHKLGEIYLEHMKEKYDFSYDSGFMIITLDEENEMDYPELFDCLSFGKSVDIEEEEDIIASLRKHISICYSPYLNTNFEEIDGYNFHDIFMKINGNEIRSFSHTKYSSEDLEENEEIDFCKEYRVIVPYREVNGVKTNVYEAMYFEDSGGNFRFDSKNGKSYEKNFPPEKGEHYITGEDSCVVRLTKLSPMTQCEYTSQYKHFEKTKQCSYLIYRNGVCSETSFIPFDGEGGFRATDAPQLRGEIHCDNRFDSVISPASNKSLIRPDKMFTQQMRSLAKYVNKELFKKISGPTKKMLEGKEYLVMPNNDVMDVNATKKLGQIKGDQVRWDKLGSLKQKGKKELIEKNNGMTPLLSKEVSKPSEVKDTKKAEYRLYTNNPESDNQDDVHLICSEEYNMIVNGEISPDIFDKSDELEEKRNDVLLSKLRELVMTIQRRNLKIVDSSGNELDMNNISIQ